MLVIHDYKELRKLNWDRTGTVLQVLTKLRVLGCKYLYPIQGQIMMHFLQLHQIGLAGFQGTSYYIPRKK